MLSNCSPIIWNEIGKILLLALWVVEIPFHFIVGKKYLNSEDLTKHRTCLQSALLVKTDLQELNLIRVG